MNLPNTLTFLGILFIGLKITGFLTWNWILVILPLLITPATLLILLLIFFVLSLYEADWNFDYALDLFRDSLKKLLDE